MRNIKLRKTEKKLVSLVHVFVMIVALLAGMAPVKVEAAKAAKISYSNMTSVQFVKEMGMGWNLGNSLDCASTRLGNSLNTETLWGNPVVTKKIIDAVAAEGFTSIRIPVTYYNHIDSQGNIDSKWLDRVEEVVGYALSNNLITIINVHHDTGMNASYRWIYADKDTYHTDAANLAKLWKQIAKRFKNYDQRLVFESMNEILNANKEYTSPEDYSVVHDLNQVFITTVRLTGGKNASRFLGLATYAAGTQSEQTIAALNGGYIDVAKDKLMLAFHCYKSTQDDINRVAYRVYENAAKYKVPVYIGEFGTKSSVDEKERIVAAKTFSIIVRKYGVACLWWDNGAEYGLFDRNTGDVLNENLVNALLGK